MNVVDEFHKLYYGNRNSEIYGRTFYKGIPCLKCPLDLWIYQEIFQEYKPEVIIELGTFNGGSALWLQDTVDNLKLDCKVVTVDIQDWVIEKNDKVEYILSDSTDANLVKDFYNRFGNKKVIVILDSLHTKEHVLKELSLYNCLIKSDGYLIVEDTNVNGHPVRPDWGDGPMEAVAEFTSTNNDFHSDISRHKFLMSFNINGYLKRL